MMRDFISEGIQAGDSSQELAVSVCSNGTTALHLALLALEIGPGDEVIVPNFGYIAAVNSIILVGATPVLADIQEDWTISANSIAGSVTDKTRAVICIDNYGILCDYESIKKVINPRIKIIQDAAESFPGVSPNEKFTIYGDIATFSFYANKFITSGEGGAVAGDLQVITKIDKLKSQNTAENGTFVHLGLGFNYRITNLQAAIFTAQWKRRLELQGKRAAIFSQYERRLSGVDSILSNNFKSNPWLATIRVDLILENRDLLRSYLRADGIETRSGFAPASYHEYVMKTAKIYTRIDNSIRISEQIISIPTYPGMSKTQVARVANSILSNIARVAK
jgi:perosamine synthetase